MAGRYLCQRSPQNVVVEYQPATQQNHLISGLNASRFQFHSDAQLKLEDSILC